MIKEKYNEFGRELKEFERVIRKINKNEDKEWGIINRKDVVMESEDEERKKRERRRLKVLRKRK